MKLNIELVRKILDQVEAKPSAVAEAQLEISTDDCEDFPTLCEHVWLLSADKYVDAAIIPNVNGTIAGFKIFRLTMKGHDFIQNARNDTVWKKAIAKAKEEGASVPLSLFHKLIEGLAKKHLGIE